MKRIKRVVITGLGVVAPTGIGKEAFWSACIAGRSGIVVLLGGRSLNGANSVLAIKKMEAP